MGAKTRSPASRPPLATETELKLRITPDAAAGIARHPSVKAVKRGRARSARLEATYYDTADGFLAGHGIALRVRREGRRWLQTVKGPAAGPGGGGVSSRTEFEWPVPDGQVDPLRFATTPLRRQLGKAEQRGLVPRFETNVMRTTIPLTFADSTMALLSVDVGEVRAGRGTAAAREPIHEIEIELEAGNVVRLYELAQALAADVSLQVETRSKAVRGAALLDPQAATPMRAVDADLEARATAGPAFAAIMRACLAQVEANVAGVLGSDDPEWIHQMRIGVRRLRACMSLAHRGYDPTCIAPIRAELRWLAQALGPARDYDVFATQTLPIFREAMCRGSDAAALSSTLRQLAARAGRRRREARVAARSAVNSPRCVQLILAVAALAATPDVAGTTTDAPLAVAARDFARPLLKRRHRTLLALGHDIAHAAPAARHAARLAAKKLRYAAEFFAPLFSRKRARNYRRVLATLQDELGAWNDAAVAVRLAGELAGEESSGAAAFAGWAAAGSAARTEVLAGAWNGFADTRVFW